ncbi:MAG: hypothetical protein HFI86_02270 [Bacilli bacterium]|nr:hypothetical protein [Bacilli bacterium]
MYNFFVVDDIEYFKNEFCELVDKAMMKNDFKYEIHSFNDYDDDFFNKVNENLPNKIFLMDLSCKQKDGLEVAEYIRENDELSIIIFITAYSIDYLSDLLDGEYTQFGFISKMHKDYQTETINKIDKAIDRINKRQIINFDDNNSSYSISINDIYYFKVVDERRVLIRTTFKDFYSSKPLKYFEDLVKDFNLKKTHRSILLNYSKVIHEDLKNKKLILNNNEEIILLSREFLKELKNKNKLVKIS